MDEICEIVDRALAIAIFVEQKEPDNLHRAVGHLERLAVELRESAPEHPALRKLEERLKSYRG